MAKATRTTASGYSITVEIVRDVQDKTLWADGWNVPAGREIVGWTLITMAAPDGRIVEIEFVEADYDYQAELDNLGMDGFLAAH